MSGKRKPFTLRERRRMCQHFGNRPRNNWSADDLPAPFAEGDVVRLVAEVPDEGDVLPRLRGMSGPMFVVTYATSIGEEDCWYFRVGDASQQHRSSDRLHVIPAEGIDWMASFELVETVDPEGLALREQMLADGWSYVAPPRCESCGQRIPS